VHLDSPTISAGTRAASTLLLCTCTGAQLTTEYAARSWLSGMQQNKVQIVTKLANDTGRGT
jgi:hypothetical protein